MIQREPALARLEPAERRDVQVGPVGDLLQRQSLLGAELAQPSPDPCVHALVCLHGKPS